LFDIFEQNLFSENLHDNRVILKKFILFPDERVQTVFFSQNSKDSFLRVWPVSENKRKRFILFFSHLRILSRGLSTSANMSQLVKTPIQVWKIFDLILQIHHYRG
jgi:hypothetical protein